MKDVLFVCVLFVANVIQSITGFAGTVLAMPPSMLLLGMEDAKVILNAMALLSGLMIAGMSFQHINRRELLKICALMAVGMAAGVQICQVVASEQVLLTVYGVLIILVAGKNLLWHRQRELPRGVQMGILVLAGVIHGMFVSGGALLVVYATQVLKDKESFRATLAPVWVVLNSILLLTQVQQGDLTGGNVRLILISVIPLLAATWLGKKLVKLVPQTVFLRLTYGLLLISGLSLVV